MTFKPGQPKIPGSGRKKGSINKKNSFVLERCRELKCDPVQVLAMIANGDWKGLGYKSAKEGPFKSPTISPSLRKFAASDLAEFCYPKLKSVEITNDEETPVNVTFTTKFREPVKPKVEDDDDPDKDA